MNLPKLNQIMRDFTMESERMETQQELIGDTLDDVMAGEEDEEEEEKIVGQVLDEIGIDITGAVPEAPSTQAEAAPAPVSAKPTAAVATTAGDAPSDSAAVDELEARLNNLRRS